MSYNANCFRRRARMKYFSENAQYFYNFYLILLFYTEWDELKIMYSLLKND